MSLPPGFLDELRARVSVAQVIGRTVTWDLRKSNQGKGDFWAPCPFHHEKTASFHVDDRKGFYYCFGCQAKGDALSFLQETQNMSFMEAVEALAREAGLPMPARDPVQREKADQRATLADVMDKAVRFYRMQLNGAAGAEARAYLDRRGLSGEQRERGEIGYAPDSRVALFQHLIQAGIPADQIVEAGLCARSDGGGQPYDRFRGRVMFPIRDARGRCIAFGGRALAEGARAKYLNSPETPLFDTGRTLFNIGPARAACGKGTPLIVAEGYMDVIALVGAGFESSVAPLGTAVTEDQLRLILRLDPEPVIALDGDKAGLRAGQRVADLALPLLQAGQGLRFALLPGGQDPDDLIKASGREAMAVVLEQAVPMVQLLWDRETAGQVFDSPERRAALKKRLAGLCARIQDPELRVQYQRTFNDLCFALFRTRPAGGPAGRRAAAAAAQAPLPGTKGSLLGSGAQGTDERLRISTILAVLAAHPALLADQADSLADIEIADPDLAALRSAKLAQAHVGPLPTPESLAKVLGDDLSRLLANPVLHTRPLMQARAESQAARRLLAHELRLLAAHQGRAHEVEAAMRDIEALADEGLTWRLQQAQLERERAQRGIQDETGAPRQDERPAESPLDRMIAEQVWVKSGKKRLS